MYGIRRKPFEPWKNSSGLGAVLSGRCASSFYRFFVNNFHFDSVLLLAPLHPASGRRLSTAFLGGTYSNILISVLSRSVVGLACHKRSAMSAQPAARMTPRTHAKALRIVVRSDYCLTSYYKLPVSLRCICKYGVESEPRCKIRRRRDRARS